MAMTDTILIIVVIVLIGFGIYQAVWFFRWKRYFIKWQKHFGNLLDKENK